MKKSKIIAPALAVLTLSTAAAVTGTVAWFTASRIAKVSMSNITAVNPEAGLSIELAAGANTSVDNEASPVAVSHVGYFRDASVDLANDVVYRAVLKDDGTEPDTYATVSSPYTGGTYSIGAGEGQNILYASKFTAKFHVSRSTSYTYALFLDVTNCGVTTPTGVTEDAIKGLRVGFKAGSEWFVWAPKTAIAAASQATNLKYVNSTSTTVAYGADHIANATLPQVNDDILATGYADNVNYLGAVPAFASSGQTTLDVTICTWIDGLEASVVNGAADLEKTFSANLQFRMLRIS